MSGGSGSGTNWADMVKVNVNYDVNKQQELVLNGVVTPIVSEVMRHLNESYTFNTTTPFSVFPPTWTQDLFEQLIASGYAQVGWGDTLAWEMKEDTNAPFDEMTHKLVCTFQWVYLPPVPADSGIVGAENGLYLLRNVTPYAECSDTGWGWNVHLDITVPSARIEAGKAHVVLAYHLVSKESDGDLFRDVTRQFEIVGDGTKHHIS